MSSLPPDMITLILIRLPVKSLLRFRCVSKPWCAQIDGSDFTNLHLTHSMSTGSNIYPIIESRGTLYSLDSDSVNNPVKIETPFININDHETRVSCTCNGLLLFENKWNSQTQSWILFNPSTRKHLALPTPPPHNLYADLAPSHQFSCLGYDVINDDYKVFNVLELVDQDNKFITSEARIYSLKSNLWQIVKDFTKEIIFDVDISFDGNVNGCLHAINGIDHRTIVALDVGKEAFNIIPMPDFKDNKVSYFRAHVFGGCLAILCLYHDKRTDIWVMKEYGVMESWSMLLSVKPEDPILVIPMVYSKSCNEVLLNFECQKLVWYDLRKKSVRDFEVRGLRDSPIELGEVCVESLVSVGGTGKFDEKKKQHGEERIKKKRDDFLSKGFKLKL